MASFARGKRRGLFAGVVMVALILMAIPATAQHSPDLQFLGLENPAKSMYVTVTLKLKNQAALDALVKQIQDKNSPMYRKYLTKAQFASQFAPSAADSKAVQNYLKSQGLTITYVDKYNLVVRASGSVENHQKAFGTQIGLYQSAGKQFNKSLYTPGIPGALGEKVLSISGLTNIKAVSHAVRTTNAVTGKPLTGIAIKSHKSGLFYPADCFETTSPISLKGPGVQAIYSGNGYSTCGYSPADLQKAYGFDSVLASGLDGTGQTIVIVDAYGSNTLAADLATFDSLNGLPTIKLNVINNPAGGTPDCTVSDTMQCGWEDETTLDVEYAHAMAPGATIDLVISPTPNFSDLADIDLWVAENITTASASHSFGFPEWLLVNFYGDTEDYDYQYFVNYIADQVFGISNNYSSGDDGDFVTLNLSPIADVSFPSGMPNATSVGGTSLAIAKNGTYKWENGWGTNATSLNQAPPLNDGFQYGAGGGTSSVTPAPAWQSAFLGNTYRQQPDVAFDADPFTGVEIIITPSGVTGGDQYVEVYGGTSLSTPMFSSVWAIVAQKVNKDLGYPATPVMLGNAAPLLYVEAALFPESLNDIKPVSSGANAHGTVFYNGIPTAYSQWQLAGPYQNSPEFWESIWNAGSDQYYAVTFGTDSSLTTGPGWDNVTGLGTPNGAKFIAPF